MFGCIRARNFEIINEYIIIYILIHNSVDILCLLQILNWITIFWTKRLIKNILALILLIIIVVIFEINYYKIILSIFLVIIIISKRCFLLNFFTDNITIRINNIDEFLKVIQINLLFFYILKFVIHMFVFSLLNKTNRFNSNYLRLIQIPFVIIYFLDILGASTLF
jgi:hypothetical protein